MYVRRDSNCQLVDQPNHVNVLDAYGNTFENWCVDFIGTDKDNATNGKTGCTNQDLDSLFSLWQPHKSDNSDRTPLPHIISPLVPGTTLEDAVTLDVYSVLGLETDRDLVLYNANNTQALQLEDATTVVSGTTFS